MDAWRNCFVANSRRDVENAMSEVWIQPTGGALGADVHGVDLSKPISDAAFGRIAEAWGEHLVLRFSGQRIDDGMLM
jgi:taurine dioxygenase